ncbi:MAG: chlorite dismutase family protein, partial [Burkholderiales bacterium]|nr:chlorite dismutase family protein [Anaerolineae bacterium]
MSSRPVNPVQHTSSQNGGPAKGRPTKRQYVRFAFYKIDPLWRRLPPEEQADQKRELSETIQNFGRRMLLRPFSLMGTRADAELLLWQIAESIEPFQQLATAMMSTRMGGYLTLEHSLLSQTKRSVYEIKDPSGEEREQLIVQVTDAKYLFIYPFVKTRNWYRMPLDARQVVMDEHITVGRKYPAVKLNTTYSFGLDDQEFVVAFETDEPADFLDLVQELRETESSLYTLRDTPLFSCVRMGLDQALDSLGGPAIAVEDEPEEAREVWVEVGPLDDFAPGTTRVIYLDGQQAALFNVGGKLYAISNRCSHARGPLSEGAVSCDESDNCTVVCPWHYAKYDLATGQVVDGIASAPVAKYEVDVRDGVIYVGRVPQIEAI